MSENLLIQKLRDMLAFSADQGPNVMVMTTQESVRAALDELELLRATPGGATEIHVLDNGSHVTGERAALLLDDELRRVKSLQDEWRVQEETIAALRAQLVEVESVLGKRGHDVVGAARDAMQDIAELRAQLAALHAASPQPAGEDKVRLALHFARGVLSIVQVARSDFKMEGVDEAIRRIDAATLRPTSPEDGK